MVLLHTRTPLEGKFLGQVHLGLSPLRGREATEWEVLCGQGVVRGLNDVQGLATDPDSVLFPPADNLGLVT